MISLSKIVLRLRIFGILSILISLMGCVSINMTTSPIYTPRPTTDYNRWLRKQPCAAPCWEGITPGVTTYKDAQKLLEQNSSFIKVELHLPDEITWKWAGMDYGGRVGFDAWAKMPTIQFISVSLLPKPAKLKDVLTTFGNPSHVGVAVEPGTDIGSGLAYSMYLYYVPSGFYLILGESGNAIFVKPSISPESEIENVIFFAPTMKGLKATNIRANPIPWQGTFDFDVYCKLQYSNELDNCK